MRQHFEHLVQSHRSEILSYLLRFLGNREDAEDVCQETFLRAYRAFSRLRAGSNGRAWLYRIATNTAINARKSRSRAEARTLALDLDQLPFELPRQQTERGEMIRLARAVQGLPPRQRAALMQRLYQGLGYRDIAAALRCSEAAARANVYQAIRKLRDRLVRP